VKNTENLCIIIWSAEYLYDKKYDEKSIDACSIKLRELLNQQPK